MTSDQFLDHRHPEHSVGASPIGPTSPSPQALGASAVMRFFHDQERQERFDELGYEVVSVFTPEDIGRLEDSYALLASQARAGFHATMYSPDANYRRAVYELLFPLVDERLGGLLVGYRVVVANWVVKEAGPLDNTVSLHQDWSFVDERRHRSINFWFPLVDVDETNGCLQVFAGSHRVSRDHRSHADRCRFDDLMPALGERYARSIPLRVGQGIVYDGALLHASGHSRSSERRVAVGSVLVPDGAELLHAFRISPTSVELFAVGPSFFWRHAPGTRPFDVPLRGIVESATSPHDASVLFQLRPAV